MATAVALEERFVALIAREVGCQPQQVTAASDLFAEKATVPFVARYRKEATGGLIDEQLENIFKRREYFLELSERRDSILASISEQGKLTAELEKAIRATTSKQELEDLYLPYKPKRRTRAQIARERGLEPLADKIVELAGSRSDPAELAGEFADPEKDVADSEAALAGARDILAERAAENAQNRAHLRLTIHRQGELKVRALSGKESEGQVYKDYFDHSEPAQSIPSHRLLAILRGEREGFLLSDLAIDDEAAADDLARSWELPLDTPCGRQIALASTDGYKRLLRPSITNEVRNELRERAELEAITVFRANLEALLLQSPLGQVSVMGLDPGYRTGCKLAVVEGTGRVVATRVIYPVAEATSKAKVEEAGNILVQLIREHGIHAVAIGNGTGSRETEMFTRRIVRDAELEKVIVAIVPETGASVYSASAAAREELPDLDVALRGAVSIARRLQDPLAELVKIDPKSLGVGQYQHDVDQKSLSSELDTAVEGAVNRVGVELNTASPALLRRVSGLSERLARNIVKHRDTEGPFSDRKRLLAVPGFGPKTFELAAGFLRIAGGDHPLDRTAVHPERYPLVQRMASSLGVEIEKLVGDPNLVGNVDFDQFLDSSEGVGRFTLGDIRQELEKPGRDPRPEFEVPEWRDDVQSIADVQVGMVLEGRVSNVTNFGAFVDIGVKRDGLVHLSELSDRWIEDPRQAVQVGKIVKVKVIDIDRERQRIGLSIRQLSSAPPTEPRRPAGRRQVDRRQNDNQQQTPNPQTSRASGSRPGPARPGPARPGPARPQQPAKPPTLEDLRQKFNRRPPPKL